MGGCDKAQGATDKDVAEPVEILRNRWSNPKLTVGEACDLQIQQARKHVEALCVKKAKLEAMNWLNHPYHEVRNLLEVSPY